MSVGTPSKPPSPTDYRLKVSAYERVASLLVALLVLLGTTVLLLLLIWLTNRIFLSQATVPVETIELGTGDSGLVGGMEIAGPTMEEIGEESDLEEPALEDRLASIADAVSTKAAQLEDPMLSDQIQRGRGGGSRGDGRQIGGGGVHRDWVVQFGEGATLTTYARQLDFFGIELGVVMPGNKVVYVYNLSQTPPDTRVGPADAEKRYYLSWRDGELQQADRALVAQANVDAGRRLILQFLPPAVEAELAQREKARAGDRADEVRQTVFGVQPDGSGYRFYVLDQSYRKHAS